MNAAAVRNIIIVLVTLLVSSTIFLTAATEPSEAYPASAQFDGRGIGAYSELLKLSGYKASVSRDVIPKLKPTDFPVGFDLRSAEERKAAESELDFFQPRDEFLNNFQRWKDHLEKGGSALLILGDTNAREVSARAKERTVTNPLTKAQWRVDIDPDLNPQWLDLVDDDPVSLLLQDSKSFLSAIPVKKGTLYVVHQSHFLTNRAITKRQNAELAIEVMALVNPSKKPIVFTEAMIGNSAPFDVFSHVGEWLVMAKLQLFFLVLVIGFTFGFSFGKSLPTPFREFAAREMVDSMGANLGRINHPAYAVKILIADSYERIRIALKLPIGTTREAILEIVPETLAKSLRSAQELVETPAPSLFARGKVARETLKTAKALESELWALESDSRKRRIS